MAVSSADVDHERARALPRPDPQVIVLFGATVDLARRKLIPGLFHLEQVGLMPEDYRIVGSTLEELDDDAFREQARGALKEFCRMDVGADDWQRFSERLAFAPARTDALAASVARAEQEIGRDTPPPVLPVRAAVRGRSSRAYARHCRAGGARA